MVNMPQRQRHNTGGGAGGAELPLLEAGVIEAHNAVTTTRCAVPLSCGCLKGYEPISMDSPTGCVRVQCNNEHCVVGTLMHGECFAAWEAHVLAYLRSCGRARSWSEKQRLQNLWTKRGYDLAYRACSCLCSRGHLRKDLDWSPPTEHNVEHNDNKTKKKKKNRQNTKPTLVTVGAGALTVNNNNNNIPGNINNNTPGQAGSATMTLLGVSNGSGSGDSSTPVSGLSCQRHRANSISSTGSSPPSDAPHSPHHTTKNRRQRDFFSDSRTRNLSDMSSSSEDMLDFHHGMESRLHHHHHYNHHPYYNYVNSVEVSKAKIWRVRPRAKGSEALTLMTLTWTGRPPSSPGPPVQLPPIPPPLLQPHSSSAADVIDCTCNCLCSLGPAQESTAAVVKHQVTSSSRSSSNSAMTVISPISGISESVMDIPDDVPDAHTGASIVLVVLWITYCHLFGSPTLS